MHAKSIDFLYRIVKLFLVEKERRDESVQVDLCVETFLFLDILNSLNIVH